jgi:hypothetical protein
LLSFDTFSARDEKHGKTVSGIDTGREVVREVTAAEAKRLSQSSNPNQISSKGEKEKLTW